MAINVGRLYKQLNAQAEAKANKLSREIAFNVYKRSQELCPVDTGNLKRSAVVERRGRGHYRVKYGSPRVRYAIYAHEQPQSMRHNGYSHFLSIAVEEAKEQYNLAGGRTL